MSRVAGGGVLAFILHACIVYAMDLGEKLSLLAAAARYDASCASSGSARASGAGGLGAALPAGVCHSWTGDGRCVSLLKILYSNACRNDCAYCVNRSSADIRRSSFDAEEIVSLTLEFYRRNYIEGLFLSSGVFSDPDIVMERLIEVARILRERELFAGYIHLKGIPGCGEALLRKAGLYADRISVNIELPSSHSLCLLAPQKSGAEILGSMRLLGEAESESREDAARLRSTPRFAPAGQSTQIIVGASPEDDRCIVNLAASLYRRYGLRRVYYSAFIPVAPDPRLPSPASPPLLREHRLYQADWLLRFYGYGADELFEGAESSFAADIDPKCSWALGHPSFFPVDAGRASYAELLRVPGIGPAGARRILASRSSRSLRSEDLRKMGIALKRASWFLSLDGRPLREPAQAEIVRADLADHSPPGNAAGRPASAGQLELELS